MTQEIPVSFRITRSPKLREFYWANKFTSGDVFVTLDDQFLGGTQRELEGYVASVVMFWGLTLAMYVLFFVWDQRQQWADEYQDRAVDGDLVQPRDSIGCQTHEGVHGPHR